MVRDTTYNNKHYPNLTATRKTRARVDSDSLSQHIYDFNTYLVDFELGCSMISTHGPALDDVFEGGGAGIVTWCW